METALRMSRLLWLCLALAALALVACPVVRSDAEMVGGPTQVRLFAPFAPLEVSKAVHVTARQNGQCFAASVASQGRSDAWRCSSGNRILDPCYEGLEHGKTVVVCPDSPWSTDAIVLALATAPSRDQRNKGDLLTSPPWALELAGGTRCQFLTGATAVVAGMRVNYGCSGRGGNVIGDIDRTQPRWRVFLQFADGIVVQQVDVLVAWY